MLDKIQSKPDFSSSYLAEVQDIAKRLDPATLERMVDLLVAVREHGGRLFILGGGGSAANASHAVNDFRKIAGIETYAPTDNVSEITARVNDEGWATVFAALLPGSHFNAPRRRRGPFSVLEAGCKRGNLGGVQRRTRLREWPTSGFRMERLLPWKSSSNEIFFCW